MPLLNYSTSISAQKTVGEIQGILAGHGAKAILMNYDKDGHIESLSFQIMAGNREIGIRLPVDPDAVLKVMEDQNVPRRLCNRQHAIQVAWRIVKTWIQAQMAIIETDMVKLDQVFLPYWIMPSGKTLYAHVVDTQFQLTEGSK